jgi:hypothetical protein
MPEHQISLGLDATHTTAPKAVPELRDEIAQAWGLPLGERIEVRLRDCQCDALTGILELVSPPDFPWNAREPLHLRIAGFPFSSRVIQSWTKV